MVWRLAVDFGTSFTTAAVAVDRAVDAGSAAGEVVEMDNSRYLPSAVFLGEDGELVVGRVAVSRGAVFPERLERVPKRALVNGDAVRLGGVTVSVVRLVAAVFGRVAAEVRERYGGAPAEVVLTHPARWGMREEKVLAEAAEMAGWPTPVFVPEPVAAARHYLTAHQLPADGCVAVYDLGGGTLDTALLRHRDGGFELVGAPGGNPHFGGLDLDDALLRVVAGHARSLDAQQWERIWSAQDRAGNRVRALWRAAITAHRELLSSAATTVVGEVGFEEGLRVTRGELEAAVENMVRGSVYELRATVDRAGIPLSDVSAVYLTGGASRMPLVSDLIHSLTGILPTTSNDPKTAVALGALRDAADEPAVPAEAAPPREVREHVGPLPVGTARTVTTTAPAEPLRARATAERPGIPTLRQAVKVTNAHRGLVLPAYVRDVAFSPTTSVLASAGNDGLVRLWASATGRRVNRLVVPSQSQWNPVTAVAFSPDGLLLVGGRMRRTVHVWDPLSGELVRTLTGHTDEVRAVAFSPDGEIVASAGADRTIRLWRSGTGGAVGRPLTGHTAAVTALAFSPDGRFLASCGLDKTIRLWDPATRRPVGRPLTGHTAGVNTVAFSPDGSLLASGGNDGSVRLWDPVAGVQWSTGPDRGGLRTEIPASWRKGAVLSVAFNPEGTLLASGGRDKAIRLWDPNDGRPVGRPATGHSSAVSAVVFSPDGRFLASGSYDSSVRLWRVGESPEG